MNFLATTESLMEAVVDDEMFQRLADIKLGLQVIASTRGNLIDTVSNLLFWSRQVNKLLPLNLVYIFYQ